MTSSIENAQDLARNVALSVAGESEQVGDFVGSVDLGEGVTDFRFTCHILGYEGWQWAVALYHDEEADEWTVDESALVPTERSLVAPKWVPWKDRLTADDLSVTDAIGTDPDDPRMEEGFKPAAVEDKQTGPDAESGDEGNGNSEAEAGNGTGESADKDADTPADADSADVSGEAGESSESADETVSSSGTDASADAAGADAAKESVDQTDKEKQTAKSAESTDAGSAEQAGNDPMDGVEHAGSHSDVEDADDADGGYVDEDQAEAVEALMLSRRHVMSPLGRSETAKRWYRGQHGPKSLSTKTADGNLCSTCAFFVPLVGELGSLFGVCANKWSADDGKVVSMDHGCGEHSEIEQPEASHLWVQTKPAYDDVHIDVVEKTRKNRHAQVELLERVAEEATATE